MEVIILIKLYIYKWRKRKVEEPVTYNLTRLITSNRVWNQ